MDSEQRLPMNSYLYTFKRASAQFFGDPPVQGLSPARLGILSLKSHGDLGNGREPFV
jgi:hypothetical protein